MAIWKLQIAIWKVKMAIWKLKVAICKFKNEAKSRILVLEPKMINNDQKNNFWTADFPKCQPQIFGPISYVGPNPFNKQNCQTRGGPARPPKKIPFVANTPF